MECLERKNDTTDVYLFLGPNSDTVWLGSETVDHKYVFLKGSGLFNRFEFPINVMCNPNDTEAAIHLLVKRAESMGDCNLANQLAGDFHSLSLNKKRRLSVSSEASGFDCEDMSAFYAALEEKLINPDKREKQLELVKRIFDEQDIEINTLPRLDDGALKEAGISQLGLRIAILSVLKKK
jgi:hypothetical protein